MLLRRKTNQEETKFEKFENRIRTSTYALMHELLQAQISTPLTYKVLLFVEFLQFLWFTIHSNFDFLWDVDVATWLRSAIKYFQVDAILRENKSSIFLILFYAFFVLQFLMLILAVITGLYLAQAKRKTSTVLTYSLKTLSVYGLLVNQVLAMPSFQIFIVGIICSKDDNMHGDLTCYEGFYFFHLAVGIIGFLISFIVSILFTMLYIELNPSSKIPFATPLSKLPLGKLLLKLVIVIYFTLDSTAKLSEGFIVVYAIIWLSILVFRYRQTPYYNKSIFNFSIGLDSMVVWAALIAIIHAFIDSNKQHDIGLFYWFLGMPFAAYAAINIIGRRAVSYRKVVVKNLNKDTDVETYLNMIFDLIENRDKSDQKMALEGLLKFHIKHCQKKDNDCVCYNLSRDYMKEEEAPEKLWYTWIKSIIIDVLDRFPKSARLHMIYAYVQREKLNNKYKALFEMMIARDNKPSMEQEFSIYRYKSLIEEEIIEDDSRNSETKGIDVNIIVQFQNSFVAFQAALENAVELHLEFWRELLENNPGIYKLQSLGSMITHSLEEMSERYKKLNDINPNHIKMLQSYGNFLKNIVNDDVEGQRILEKAEYVVKSTVVNKQFIENDRLKYGENSNTCIVTVSGNFNNMGIIKNVNNEITRILGFSKADIIGQNVNRIIPKYLAELHDSLMRNYFETSEPRVLGVERFVFPLSKKGYVVPCTLMIKVLPDLERGVRLVGFLNEVESENGFAKNADFDSEEKVHYIVYSGDTGAIHGFTQSCKKDFGLPSSLIYGAAASTDFTMDVIFPELLGHNLEDLKNPAGVVTTLDTSTLQQDYLLAHTESEGNEYEEEQDEEAEEKKYRKTNVRAVIVEDSVYQNLNMRVLKFTEIIEDKEMVKIPSVTREEAAKDDKSPSEKGANHSKDEMADEKLAAEDVGSDKDSNHSVADAAGEELKQLKDFKALISEKTEPRSIKNLSRALIALIVLLMVLACVELSYRLNQASDFEEGLTSIVQAYQRHNLMASINFKTRQLNSLAFYQINTTNLAEWTAVSNGIKGDLISLIDELSSVQFEIMKATELLKSDGADTYDSQNIDLEHLLEVGTRTEKRIYTDAVFQYITAASSIRNTTLSALTIGPKDASVKNFYFVRKNGLGPLRSGSEAEAQNFYDFYVDKTNKYNNIFLIMMIVGIVVLVISEMILIPIVFSVHKTNNRVLSLFGYIPSNEIDELAAKCEEYMEEFLEDHKERKDYSFEQSEGDIEPSNRGENENSSYLEVSQNQEVAESEQASPNISLQLDVSEHVKASPVNTPVKTTEKGKTLQDSLKVPAGKASAQSYRSGLGTSPLMNDRSQVSIATHQESLGKNKLVNKSVREDRNGNVMKEDEKKKDDADLEAELAYNKSQKLLNSKDNRRSKVMVQFIGIALLFLLYFLLNYLWLEKRFVKDIKTNLEHLKLSAERMSQIRYLLAFAQEEITMANDTAVYSFVNDPTDTTNLRLAYNQLIQDNNKRITDPSNLDFDGTFDSYLSEFNTYTTGDLCDIYYVPRGEGSSCTNGGTGLLSSGVTLAITTISLNTGDVVKDFKKDLDAKIALDPTNATYVKSVTNTTQFSSINGIKFNGAVDGTDLIMPPLEQLISDFSTTYNKYLSNFKEQEIIKFVVYLCFCFFVFLALWLPYRKNLSDKIFRTKGMLNMIPMEIITKNENLKALFLAGDILQGVK